MAWLTATYLIDADAEHIEAAPQALAIEQSVECPLEAVRDERIRDEVVARVAAIAPAGDGPVSAWTFGSRSETTCYEPAQFMNMVFGNCSLWDDVQLVDLDLPPALLARFGGPRHGIAGIRALVDAPQRALTSVAMKPQGMPTAELARMCRTFALGGHRHREGRSRHRRSGVLAVRRARAGVSGGDRGGRRRDRQAVVLRAAPDRHAARAARARAHRARRRRTRRARGADDRRAARRSPTSSTSSPSSCTSRTRRSAAPRASRRRCCSAASSGCSAPTRRSSSTTAAASRIRKTNAARSPPPRARRGATCARRCRCPRAGCASTASTSCSTSTVPTRCC